MNTTPTRLTLDFLGFVACASMLVGAYVFGVRTWLEATDRNRVIAVETARLVRESAADRETQSQVREAARAVEEVLAEEGVSLATTTELTGRLIMLGSLAKDAGVAVETLSPRPLEPGKAFDRQPIALRCLGRYPDCVRLLGLIRETDPTIAARVITLRRGTSEGEATLDAELVWFVQAGPSGE